MIISVGTRYSNRVVVRSTFWKLGRMGLEDFLMEAVMGRLSSP